MAMIPAPTVGATTGTVMNVAITNDMVRAMRSPSKLSRTIASASDRGAAAPMPHTTRQAMSQFSDGANDAAAAAVA